LDYNLTDIIFLKFINKFGTARTPFPANKNYTHELFTLGIIAEVNSAVSAMAKPHSGGTAFVITVNLYAR